MAESPRRSEIRQSSRVAQPSGTKNNEARSEFTTAHVGDRRHLISRHAEHRTGGEYSTPRPRHICHDTGSEGFPNSRGSASRGQSTGRFATASTLRKPDIVENIGQRSSAREANGASEHVSR